MLTPMQKDVAIEMIATIRANMYDPEHPSGNSKEMLMERIAVRMFKHEVHFRSHELTWKEITEFNRHWIEKYPF